MPLISPPALEALVQQCAPNAAPQTVLAIVHTESRGRPWALNVNGRSTLARQPASRAEAAAWAQWLIDHGYSVDLGLMQVNSRHLARFGATPAQMLDPCFNIAAGASILTEFYSAARVTYGPAHDSGPVPLLAAISAYPTGNFRSGLRDGYVNRVVDAAARPGAAQNAGAPELLVFGAAQQAEPLVLHVPVPR
jgi:type IV secretion system protein VirB1